MAGCAFAVPHVARPTHAAKYAASLREIPGAEYSAVLPAG
jgi:hypothetical protein